MQEQKRKANTRKNNSTWKNKTVSTGGGREIKEISTKVKTILTKHGFPKQRKKIPLGGGNMKTYQQPDAKETQWLMI